jgi:hypothetical protein
MELDSDGAQLYAGAGLGLLEQARRALPISDEAGLRLSATPALRPLLARGSSMARIAERALGPAARPVRALLFDKNSTANWSLGWHQDRVICVRERIDQDGFGPWTSKRGLIHVVPPVAILAAMVTLRFHLDDVPDDNAPLLVAPGSHLLGRVAESGIEEVVARCGTRACTAEAGDIWAYATLILHASEAARRTDPGRRRVLQVDYSASDLPGGLEWLGLW